MTRINVTIGFCIIMFIIALFAGISADSKIKQANKNNTDANMVSKEIEDGAPGTLLYSGNNGQCIRMWEMPHRMEWWLMHQDRIEIERIYCINTNIGYRYYIQYWEKDINN